MSQNTTAVDLLTIPLDGLAAYWLSLRKPVGSARNLKALENEAAFAADAYIRHLPHMALSSLPALPFGVRLTVFRGQHGPGH